MDIISLVIGLAVGAVLVFAFKVMTEAQKKKQARSDADKIISKAKSTASKIEKDAKHKAKDFEQRARKNAEADIRKQKDQLKRQEQSFVDKEKKLDRNYRDKQDKLESQRTQLKVREEKVKAHEGRMSELEADAQAKISELKDKLLAVANFSPEQAKEEMKSALEQEMQSEASRMVVSIEEDAKEKAEQKAKRIIGMAIARYAGEFSAEKNHYHHPASK